MGGGVGSTRWVKDKDGNEFALYDETWRHIRQFHPEISRVEIIESVLLEPDVMMRSSWDPNSLLYYRRCGHLYRVVVVQTEERRIKTTLTERKIKEGEIVWLNPRLLV